MPVPSVLSPTPKELAAATQEARETSFGTRRSLNPPPPPPGTVRVHFYSHMYKVIRGSDPDIWADVVLERNGDLDVSKLCKMWGLDHCLAIDPMRWTVQRRPDESRLSGIAVHVLSNEFKRPIMFTELPPVSKQTARVRTSREIALSLSNACYLFFRLLLDLLMDFFNCCTPVPYWCRKTKFYYTHIDWKRYRQNIKYTTTALNNDLTVARAEYQTSAQSYISEKRGQLGESSRRHYRRFMEAGQELLYDLACFGWELSRLALYVIIPVFILWLMSLLIHKWHIQRAESRFQRDVQLAFQ
ncbi:hypothetical protein K435DRAFT_781890 [Dendrothele bispora CBS 962.96]|uniref:Uncharacterized protein n=1 Tax=Dendrothele bispora (strain CBS 962.96) TaxID=1314807 RepID=A0A4S8LIA3_DENBC|nr:hypothetical protein K435DRAFT_781890 [Dendrothele bispora CBS 962.96]